MLDTLRETSAITLIFSELYVWFSNLPENEIIFCLVSSARFRTSTAIYNEELTDRKSLLDTCFSF